MQEGLTRRELLTQMATTAVAARLGGWGCARAPELRFLRLSELPRTEFDVCVIGSGPAGSVLASRLAGAGNRTVVLESGVPPEAPPPGWSGAGLDVYEATGLAYPVAGSRFRGLGGTSNLWTGRCSRLHPLDFEPNPYTPPGSAWPLRYDDLAAYYDRAEHTLRVNGGTLSQYHAPRAGPLPRPALGNVSDLRELTAPLDVTLDASPTSEGTRGEGPIRAARDLLPDYTNSASGTLVIDATVTGLRADAEGVVGEAEVRDRAGSRVALRAGTFVVACGALETARLLLLSRSARHPRGLGNRGGLLGRGFNDHPNVTFYGSHEGGTDRWSLARSHQFYESFKGQGLGSVLLVFSWSPPKQRLRIGASVEMLPAEANRVTLTPAHRDAFGNPGLALSMTWSPEDERTLAAVRALIRGFFDRLGGSSVREDRLSWSHHHLGTCRMGVDPESSVLDADLRVHGTRNLYALTSGAVVTGGAAHPTLTIVALAHRLADHLGA